MNRETHYFILLCSQLESLFLLELCNINVQLKKKKIYIYESNNSPIQTFQIHFQSEREHKDTPSIFYASILYASPQVAVMPLCRDKRRQEAAVQVVGDKITSRQIQLRTRRTRTQEDAEEGLTVGWIAINHSLHNKKNSSFFQEIPAVSQLDEQDTIIKMVNSNSRRATKESDCNIATRAGGENTQTSCSLLCFHKKTRGQFVAS